MQRDKTQDQLDKATRALLGMGEVEHEWPIVQAIGPEKEVCTTLKRSGKPENKES